MNTRVALAEQTFTEDLYKTEGKFLVLIPGAWQELTTPEKNLLAKVLEAIHTSTSTVQILSVEQADAALLNIFKPSFVISFGVSLPEVGRQYALTTLNGTEVIWADQLKEIDQPRKEKLWPVLKSRFLAQ